MAAPCYVEMSRCCVYLSKFALYLLVLLCLLCVKHTVETPHVVRPRGVPLSKASLYDPEKNFGCLDGSNVIPFHFVNDDYCDCADGSDEPGTSACPHGFFHCTNAGYIPKFIPSSRVNDGICDCCDLSDEYDSPARCINDCKELGGHRIREQKEKLEQIQKGFETRQLLAKEGTEKKKEHEEKLEQLQQELQELEVKKRELEVVKKAAEEPEKQAKEAHEKNWQEQKKQKADALNKAGAEAAFPVLDVDGDGIITPEELMVRTEFDMNDDGVITEEELKTRFGDEGLMDWDLETFTETMWYKLKYIYQHPKDEEAEVADDNDKEPEPFSPPSPSVDVTEGDGDGSEHALDEEEDEDDDDDDDDDFLEGEDDDEDAGDMDDDKDGAKDKMPEYETETKRLIQVANDARNAYEEAQQQHQTMADEIKNLERYTKNYYGQENEFLQLDKQCFEYTEREYIYKLCLYDKVSQRPKAGGGETSLGVWDKWLGTEDNEFDQMSFSDGVQCWNGPKRSAKVMVTCGLENQLLSASEPNRCEYLFTFTTPAVCTIPTRTPDLLHDEL
ncbi:PREDICTED: glucosidase 2 subunit beta-like [Priapulus caudatus]|uniref:Glucosidase 2 subunit beta n=1 Tax=Priapulus caudatus TaxID=37621 RepID=A0ABM1ES61_PRICU|nr:PREDICTED: glucosidase 2 subunit beta-like [Priapulus caudatus]